MAVNSLLKAGWPLNKEKLRLELEKIDQLDLFTAKATKKKEVISILLNMNIVNFSQPIIPENLSHLKAPVVLQLSRWRNVSHSVVKNHQGHTGVCRLELTDGHKTISGFSTESLSKLSGKTPYGAKLLLKSPIQIEGGLLLLSNTNTDLLGGEVVELKEEWSRERMQIITTTESKAPKWVCSDYCEEKKREADEKCHNFNSFKCFSNTPWITQQQPANNELNKEFNRKRHAAVESISVPRKRPRYLFHKHW